MTGIGINRPQDAAQISRQIRHLSDTFARLEDDQAPLHYQILLDRVIVALTSPQKAWKSEENFSLAVQTLSRNLSVDLVPQELNGYFLNRLVACLIESLSRDSNDGASTSTQSKSRFPFIPSVLVLLPHFFNNSMRQAMLEVGNNGEFCSSDELRERTMVLFRDKRFYNVAWASELLEQLKLLDFTPKEIDIVCENLNQVCLDDEAIPVEAVAPICFAYLSLSTKTGARLPLIMSGITHLFHLLEQRIQQDDYHESQTGTQAMRAVSNDKLRETENLVFITFEQYFQSHPSIAFEFINITRHAIAKGGLYHFSIGLLLSMLKTSRPTKVSDKALEALLMWCRSSKNQQEGPSNSRAEINGKYIPLVLQNARPTFEDFGTKNQRWVDAALVSAGPLSMITLKSVVSACLEGWDACIFGLVDLAFEMVNLDLEDANKSKPSSKGPKPKETGFLTTAGEYSKEAADVLRKLFEGVEIGVRTRIMDSLFLNLVTRPEVATVFVEILSAILSSNRGRMAPFIPKFQEMVYQIGSLPPSIAKRLIGSLETLMSSHHDFKDLVVMVLRKASFSHETTARCAASSGFVQLLRAHLTSLVTSRTLSPALAEQICLECLSFVRRSLSQQSFIRATLYRDLAAAFNDAYGKRLQVWKSTVSAQTATENEETVPLASMEMKPPASHYPPGTLETLDLILESIVELMLSQLSTVILEEQDGLKFEITNCLRSLVGAQAVAAANRKLTDTPTTAKATITALSEIQEPLHVLFMSANCMIYGEAVRCNGLSPNAHTMVLYNFLDRFVKFMLDSELEQFALDKTSDFSLETPEGLANQEAAMLLLGIYEMCIEYLLMVVQTSTHKHTEDDEEEQSNMMMETEDDSLQRYKSIHKLFRMILQLKGIMKDAKGAVKLVHPGNAKKELTDKVKEADGDEIEDDEEEPKARAKKAEKSKPKQPSSIPSLFSRQCIVDLLTLLCNPIKAISLRGPDNLPITTPLTDLANDFGAVQYVLTAALAQAQSISSKSKSSLQQNLSTEEAIEGIRRNMGSADFWNKIAGFLLYEASSGPKRVAPIGVKKTDVLALEIYVQGLKIVSQDSNQNRGVLAKFSSNSVSYLIMSNPLAKRMLEPNLEPEDKIALFVELIQALVTPELCFETPHTAELWLSLIELLAPLLAPKHLTSVSSWIESLIALHVENEMSSQVEERRMTNELGLKLVPLMWSLFDRRAGNEALISYLMFARDIFVTCGGNASESHAPGYVQEDEQRNASHSLTFSVTARSTVQDIALTLLEQLERRIQLIEVIHMEIENAEKFVVVGLGDGMQVDPEDGVHSDSESDSSDDSEEEIDMSTMMTGRPAGVEPNRKRASRANEMADEDFEIGDMAMTLHLKRKSVLYRDLTEVIEVFYCLAATRLPNGACIAFAKILDRFFKLVHTWFSAKLKRKQFEPIFPAFETFVGALGQFFGRLHVWLSSWLRAEVPFLPTEEKKRSKLVQQARTAASKHMPTLVYWMEKIHAEDLIKLAARADHPSLLTNFKVHSNHEITIGQELLSKKRKIPTVGPIDPQLKEAKPKIKRPRKAKD